ncbi:MAG: hypothetical protein MJA29_05510 [Candidatus Omnitrophica bacterium]|nr:hypothetical protein [Candidatus Omnitrophota bacterium]
MVDGLIRHFPLRKLVSSAGFTIAELLLAAGLLTVALTSILALYSKILIMNESSREQFTALSHAEYVLAEIRDTDFKYVDAMVDGGSWDWSETYIQSNGLTPLTNESIDTSSTGTDVLDVSTSVTWTDRQGSSRSMTVQTKIVE